MNDSFEIYIIKYSNHIVTIGDLSYSEKKLVKLSLIFAIYFSLGLKFPIILMNPFSNLDEDKINGFFKFIFEKFDNQIIFILNNSFENVYIKNKFLKNNVFCYQLTENHDVLGMISYEK